MKFLGYKLVRLLILLTVIAAISFIMIDLSPIDPVRAYLGEMSNAPEQIEKLSAYWGVGVPIQDKIVGWLEDIVQLKLGTSLIYRIPVTQVIMEKFTASLVLMAVSWVISGIVGFSLGIISGAKRGTWIDKIIKTYCYILQSSPAFWIALIVLIIFSVWLNWFPIGLAVPVGVMAENVTFWEWLHRLILPAFTLSIVGISSIALYTRDRLVNIENSDFFLFAKSRGEKHWSIIIKHGIRNVILPAITLQFLSFSELFGGAVLVEQVFSYPGIGQATIEAGLRSDVPLLLGIVLVSTIFVFVGNTIADILYKYVDPRMRGDGDE
ncbi:MAG: ABC transporter permease [Methanosphaera stadtmanae]|jgi:peptide/nickel transport system permease protein|nr:ABC transporter permease [Methanosphaera stadtmanae]